MESRICKKDFFVDNELKLREIVKEIDDYDKYFLPITSISNIVLSNTNPLTDGLDTGHNNDSDIYNKMGYYLIECNAELLNKCKSYDADFVMFYMTSTYNHLINALNILRDHDIFHLNINEDTICWNKTIKDGFVFYNEEVLLTTFNKSLHEPSLVLKFISQIIPKH